MEKLVCFLVHFQRIAKLRAELSSSGKDKHYLARVRFLCGSVTAAQIRRVHETRDVQLTQKTPIRVIQARSMLDRAKEIRALYVIDWDTEGFLLRLWTSVCSVQMNKGERVILYRRARTSKSLSMVISDAHDHRWPILLTKMHRKSMRSDASSNRLM